MDSSFDNKCTIVVSSCDKYEDLWPAFFTLLNRAWPDNPYQVVLNTESKSFEYKDIVVKTFQLYKDGEYVPWGKRLRETLRRIDSEYILFFLDDFLVDGKIESDEIFKCIQAMDKDKDISVFSFMETFVSKYDDGVFENFERRKLIGKYKFNCQAALWRRVDLIKYLRDNESPWEWEIYGTWRSYRLFEKKFYSRKAESKQIIPYIFDACGHAHGGLVVVGGKWYEPMINYFESKYDLFFDRQKRGIITEKEFAKRFETESDVKNWPEWKKRVKFLRKPYAWFRNILDKVVHIRHLF